MRTVRAEPCSACPYRQDSPSGLWAHHEYEKLRQYDEPTADQPMAYFACHATPDHYCNGWAICHSNRGNEFDLLALRFAGRPPIPEPKVPLFGSGAEAADHGQRDIDDPPPETTAKAEKLLSKYPRLEWS